MVNRCLKKKDIGEKRAAMKNDIEFIPRLYKIYNFIVCMYVRVCIL